MESLKQKESETENHLDMKQKKFGFVKMIAKADYVREVNEAGEGVDVILHMYKDSVEKCVLINRVMEKLAVRYPSIKFLKTISDKCVENFPDSQLPYILYYRDGKRKQGVQKIELKALLPKVTEKAFIRFLGLIEVESVGNLGDEEEEMGVKDTVRNQLGWKRKLKKSEFDSDSDGERDFVSNKIKFK